MNNASLLNIKKSYFFIILTSVFIMEMASLCLHADRQHQNSISELQYCQKMLFFIWFLSLGALRAQSDQIHVNVFSRFIRYRYQYRSSFTELTVEDLSIITFLFFLSFHLIASLSIFQILLHRLGVNYQHMTNYQRTSNRTVEEMFKFNK